MCLRLCFLVVPLLVRSQHVHCVVWSEWLCWSMEQKTTVSGRSVEMLDKDMTLDAADDLRCDRRRSCDNELWFTVPIGELAGAGQSPETVRSRQRMKQHCSTVGKTSRGIAEDLRGVLMPDGDPVRRQSTDDETSSLHYLMSSAHLKPGARVCQQPNDLSLPDGNHRDRNLVCSAEHGRPSASDRSRIHDANKLSLREEQIFHCEKCQQSFDTKVKLQKHIGYHRKHEETFHCSRCSQFFFNWDTWEKHNRLHQRFDARMRQGAESITSVHACPRCERTFDCQFMLARHEYNHTNSDREKSRVFRCSRCPRTFATDALRREHYEMSHGDGASTENICQVCSRAFLRRSIMYNHMERLHSREELSKIGPVHACSKCSQIFVLAERLRVHVVRMHRDSMTDSMEVNGSRLQCSVCSESFEDPLSLRRHRRTHGVSSDCVGELEKPAQYVCSQCGRVFRSMRTLNCHVRTHTGARPFACRVAGCTKRFAQHGTRKFHERTHSDDMPHICPVCGRRFKHPTTVRLHMSVHTGAKPHQCPSCPMRFRRSCDLARHALMHSDRRPFSCSSCQKSFKTKKTLSRHILALHTDEVPWRCSVCDKGFKTVGNMRVHMRVHTGDRPYVCEVCGSRFAYSGSLKSHMQVHSGHD